MSNMNWERTLELMPDGVQTLSKMPSKHIDPLYPKYIVRGEGACVWGSDGKKYIDYPCGLGSVLLGYNYAPVNKAIVEQLGKGVNFSLPNYLETELAELICDMIPSCEMVRFLKTGSEACHAAIKIARAVTGKSFVIACGYHGWHTWYSAVTPKNLGTLDAEKSACIKVEYGNTKQLEITIDSFKDKLAAVIVEPYIYEPNENFLKILRNLCTQHKIILIFDEIVTGFRTKKYSAQAMFKIIPDLTCLGKALGNGLPIAVIGGKKEYMEILKGDCFVSSTFGGELLSIAAAIAVIKELQQKAAIEHIWWAGDMIQSAFNDYSSNMGLEGVKCIGLPCRTFFKFPTEAHKSLFWQECIKKGIFFGYAQFTTFSHNQPEIDETLTTMRHALSQVRRYWENPEKAMEGKVAQETFRLVATKS